MFDKIKEKIDREINLSYLSYEKAEEFRNEFSQKFPSFVAPAITVGQYILMQRQSVISGRGEKETTIDLYRKGKYFTSFWFRISQDGCVSLHVRDALKAAEKAGLMLTCETLLNAKITHMEYRHQIGIGVVAELE